MSTSPWPWGRQQRKRRFPSSRKPGQWKLWLGLTSPLSSAASATIILKVEPGEYWPVIDLLLSGKRGWPISSRHCFSLMPAVNRLGS